MTDTHTHLYLEQFDEDRHEVVKTAIAAGVKYMLLPNIYSKTIQPMLELCDAFPQNIFPMMGLHPTDVKDNFSEELLIVEQHLETGNFYAVGETGIDLYWDTTFLEAQQMALGEQIRMAKTFRLPIVLHVRDSFEEVFKIIDDTIDENLTGVFHCFTGNLQQAERIIDWGFKLGIGGVLTYKNSGLDNVVKAISTDHLVLETDAPFLTPKPFRGKRNESSYIKYVAEKLAEIKNISVDEIAEITTRNAVKLFKFPMGI
ncbi:MAG: TatD family hydrolase [Bacteroidales bacterium]|nr:TatD family hydrolase [Bacteroidales bacterium]